MPDIQSYARLFDWFKVNSSTLYLGKTDELTTMRLIENLASLAAHKCRINDELPDMFIEPLRKFNAHDPEARRFFDDIDKRAFFLSDLLDFISLYKGNRGKSSEHPGDE